MNNSIWVTWENHRRSRELATALGARYHALTMDKTRWVRYPRLSVKTLVLLIKLRPRIVFSQNPSMVLATLLCIFAPILGFELVIDRHSNFKFETSDLPSIKWKVFHMLSRWTAKKADLTIVTNEYLANLIEEFGGKPFVLQDKLPDMDSGYARHVPHFIAQSDKPKVMFVTTFSDDEPIKEILSSKKLAPNTFYYVTGNYSKSIDEVERQQLLERNIVLTGFVSDEDYFNLMRLVDLVVVLTTEEHLLTCGAYEALAMKKPLVLSDTKALRNYFSEGALYVAPSSESIGGGVNEALSKLELLEQDIQAFLPVMVERWDAEFAKLEKLVSR